MIHPFLVSIAHDIIMASSDMVGVLEIERMSKEKMSKKM